MIVIPLVLVLAGGAYKFAFAKDSGPPPKIDGTVYVMPKEFIVNLRDGRLAKLSVALVLNKDEVVGAGHEAATPPEGYGALEQEAVVRDIITNQLTGESGSELIRRAGRDTLKKRILTAIKKMTDVEVERVLFTDVAVQ